MTALSSLSGKEFSEAVTDKLINDAVENNILHKWGGWTSKSLDYVRSWYNKKNPDDQVITLRHHYFTAEWWDLMRKGYTLVTSARLSSSYWKDAFDGELDSTDHGEGIYGHVFSICMKDEDTFIVIENYEGRHKANYYEIELHELEIMVANFRGTKISFLPACYAFLYKNDFEEINEKKPVISNWAKKAWGKWGKYIGSPDKNLSLQDVEKAFHKMDVRTQLKGKISGEELAVIVDRISEL